ncbi:MAG: penicillin-binding protein 2 [Anaerolineaceae bacterium]|nr:MAG: penicillin-binding protein 2 [Anaerolineaceae bacterium]
MQDASPPPQEQIIRQRMSMVTIGTIVIAIILIIRLMWFQFPQSPRVVAEFAVQRRAAAGTTQIVETGRGHIYDRNGNPLAVNRIQYRVFISPNILANPERTAADLARILQRDELELFNQLRNRASMSEFLGVVDAEAWRQIRDLNLLAVEMTRLQRRDYPQGSLGSQVIGFVSGIGDESRGNYGVEGYYQAQLAGQVFEQEVSNIPFNLPEDLSVFEGGADLVLTLDRDVQFLAESELQRAITETGAQGGTIIIMNPRNGDVLGMASYPTYDPNFFFAVENPALLRNPAIMNVYEPGSVFKVLTVAAGIETGVIDADWMYNDQGVFEVSGQQIYNWDRRAYGPANAERVLVDSLNVGVATIAREMGPELFYGMMNRFGIGQPTRIDLQGEERGIMRTPNDLSGEWSESDLATNSFGQGLSLTPLQMLTAVNAIANDGLIMQPRIVYQIIDGDQIITSNPEPMRQAISAQTAGMVRDMMVAVVEGDLDNRARVPGYSIAGKTGTAEISTPLGYESNAWIMSFVGFLPADDPQVSILIKLDRPTSGRWASEVAAPVFSRLVSRLVILLEIPNDDIRRALTESGVAVGEQK